MNLNNIQLNVQLLLRTLRENTESAGREDLEHWLELASETIRELEELINEDILSRYKKQKCQTMLMHLIGVRHRLRELLQRFGGSLEQEQQTSEPNVRWDDMPSAFRRRIRSGVITNLGHRNIDEFMDEAKTLFKEKIETTLQQFDSLKVNAELSAEYAIEKDDSEETEVKYFNMEASIIQRSTNLDSWFENNIREAIQREMDEFQERGSGWTLRQILSILIYLICIYLMHLQTQ